MYGVLTLNAMFCRTRYLPKHDLALERAEDNQTEFDCYRVSLSATP